MKQQKTSLEITKVVKKPYKDKKQATPSQDALQRASGDELHEDVDGAQVYAGAQVADDVLVPQATEDLHLHLDFIVLLDTEVGEKDNMVT